MSEWVGKLTYRYLYLPFMSIKANLTGLLLAISFSASAQVQMTVFGGPQITSARYSVGDTIQPTQYKTGFMFGAGAKVVFDKGFYFFPAIYYSMKGYKVTLHNPSFPPTELALDNNTTIHTIEIAPLFQIDLSSNTSHFFLRFGPSVDFAFLGREHFDTAMNAPAINRNMKFDFTEYGHFTASANIHIGYESNNGIMVFAQYAYGIGNLNNADGGPRILNRVFGISVGWLFDKIKDKGRYRKFRG
jgi:hypothetical protein